MGFASLVPPYLEPNVRRTQVACSCISLFPGGLRLPDDRVETKRCRTSFIRAPNALRHNASNLFGRHHCSIELAQLDIRAAHGIEPTQLAHGCTGRSTTSSKKLQQTEKICLNELVNPRSQVSSNPQNSTPGRERCLQRELFNRSRFRTFERRESKPICSPKPRRAVQLVQIPAESFLLRIQVQKAPLARINA